MCYILIIIYRFILFHQPAFRICLKVFSRYIDLYYFYQSFCIGISENRLESWNRYRDAFEKLEQNGLVELPHVPEECVHNAHMFYLKLKDLEQRTRFIAYMKEREIQTVFHYVPLHSAPAGLKFGRFSEEDVCTTKESERLVRLPLYYGLKKDEIDKVIQGTLSFFQEEM